MIVTSIQSTFTPNDADKVESLLRELRDASVKEPGVLQFEIARSRDKPNVFAMWEVYRDQDAVDAHRQTEHYARLVVNGIRPLVQHWDVEMMAPI